MNSNYDKQVDIGRTYFLKYDTDKIAKNYKLEADENYLYLNYLRAPYRIEKSTAVIETKISEGWQECRNFNIVMTIYDILTHSPEKPPIPLTGEWTPIGSFVISGASPSADTFSQKYAEAFDKNVEALKKACAKFGEILPRLAGADVTAKIQAFDFFPVLFQFWEGDDEFAPQVKLLWDKNTLAYLNFETTYYLQGDLLDQLLANL